MSRIITCENNDGLSIRFGYQFAPWLLTDCEGIYQTDVDIYTSANTMIDGSTYQGSTLKERNIVLTMIDRGFKHKYNRQVLYDVFKPKSPITFSYDEGGEVRKIDGYVESVESTTMGNIRTATISLICPDPYFKAEFDTVVVIAGWSAGFMFPHTFTADREEFGGRSTERLKTIVNDTAADNIGVTFDISADGDIVNPSITCVETQQAIHIGTTANPFTLHAGEVIRITTETNNKHIYLISGGVTTEINNYLSEESEFIQLMRGDNTIGYAAEEGVEYMTLTATFRYKYLGV